MSQNQDRVSDVLAERIAQLEGALRAAVAQKDRAEKETRFVKDEAYEVVGQWSAENTELRTKLTTAQQETVAAQKVIQNRDDTIACLKEELDIAQQLTAKYSDDIEEQRRDKAAQEQKAVDIAESLAAAQAAVTVSSQQISDYERLIARFQHELQDMITARKEDARMLDDLRQSLTSVTNENHTLRQAGADVSSSTAKLLDRVTRLKGESDSFKAGNALLTAEKESLAVRLATAEHTIAQQTEELAQLRERATANKAETAHMSEDLEQLEKKLQYANVSLTESQTVADQQLGVIQNLESDIQELKDAVFTSGKAMTDLRAEADFMRQQTEELSRQKDDLDTEFTAVKECYSTLLIEFDDYKQAAVKSQVHLEAELAGARKDLGERLDLMEANYRSAWSSVQELTGALHAQQCSEFAKKEQIARLTLSLEQQNGVKTMIGQFFHMLAQSLSGYTQTIEKRDGRIAELGKEALRTAEGHENLINRFRASEQTLSEQRKAFSALESKYSQATMRLKENMAERDGLSKDNDWLKQQVESMRSELSELDEILNSSLNEMREENERLQVENETLSRKVTAADEKDASTTSLLSKLGTDISELEAEMRAQTKTLEITEAELQASKAQLANAITSLQYAQTRTKELEETFSGAEKERSSLSAQVMELQERVSTQDAKLSSVLSEKRREMEAVRLKLNSYAERYDCLERALHAEKDAKREAEAALVSAKEQNAKLRSALDELKNRCSSDTASLRELLAERDDLIRDRDIIVEKYNKLHDAFRNVRKEAHGKIADELRRVMELAVSQEAELQNLRQQNMTLKKSVSMFVESAQPKAEAIFMERLNLTEGPLRHPKKRSTANTTD